MEYRIALPTDTEDVRKLWEYCFDDSDEFNDWFYKDRYKPENTLVAVCDNRIASALQILPYTIQLRGKPMKTSYLVGVSTWPEDRGKGYVSRLLHYSLEEMRRREQWISILLPFKYEFYRKYGWETCYSHLVYSGSVESFNSYTKNVQISGHFQSVNDMNDIPLLQYSYRLFTNSLNGFIKRDTQDWIRLLNDVKLDKGYVYLYKNGEDVLGYMIYYLENREFSIREMVFLNEKAKLEMLKFAANHSDIVDQIQWKAPNIRYVNPNIGKHGIKWSENPFVMGWIVDVKKILKKIMLGHGDIELDLTVKVIDPLLEWNNRTYKMMSQNGNIAVVQTTQKPDFIIHVTVLAQIIWGYLSIYQAIEQGEIKATNGYTPAKFDQFSSLFCETVPYIYEDY